MLTKLKHSNHLNGKFHNIDIQASLRLNNKIHFTMYRMKYDLLLFLNESINFLYIYLKCILFMYVVQCEFQSELLFAL